MAVLESRGLCAQLFGHAAQSRGRHPGQLATPFVERAHLRDAYPDSVLVIDGWSVGGPVKSHVVRGKSLTLDTVTVADPVASLSTAKAGSFSGSNYEGNVGSGFLKRFVVADVADGGAAKEAGLVVGDIITAIDGKPAASLALSDAREFFRVRPEGSVMRLDIVWSGSPRTVAIALRSRL